MRRSGMRWAAATAGSGGGNSGAAGGGQPVGTQSHLALANGVATLTLQRPERKNALGKVLVGELEAAIQWCAASPDVRAVLLQSSLPDIYCAGADLKERRDMTRDEAKAFVRRLRALVCAVEDLPMPTIAVLEGAALGGGLELALGADMRIVGANCTMGFPETGLGIIPGAGGTQWLPRLIGESAALLLIASGERVNADEAMRLGLVNRVVPAGQAGTAAAALAQRIAANAPIAVRAAKAALRGGRGWVGEARSRAMAAEARQYDVVLATEDRLEALQAFSERRPPVFRGR